MNETTDLVQYIVDLEDLVRWLAITYGDNDPIWTFDDEYGNHFEHNVRLDATWHKVVRGLHGTTEEREDSNAQG
jgi:hypothetical protein